MTRQILSIILILTACGPLSEPATCSTALPLGGTTIQLDCPAQCELHALTVPDGACAAITTMDATGHVLECAIVTDAYDLPCVSGGSARVWVEALVDGECQRRC